MGTPDCCEPHRCIDSVCGACVSNGGACTSAEECCSFSCGEGTCCTPVGESCEVGQECCVGFCADGICAIGEARQEPGEPQQRRPPSKPGMR